MAVKSKKKYGSKASSKVKRAMHERKQGTLKSGRSGKQVKSRRPGSLVSFESVQICYR
jgi:hypothetical protein